MVWTETCCRAESNHDEHTHGAKMNYTYVMPIEGDIENAVYTMTSCFTIKHVKLNNEKLKIDFTFDKYTDNIQNVDKLILFICNGTLIKSKTHKSENVTFFAKKLYIKNNKVHLKFETIGKFKGTFNCSANLYTIVNYLIEMAVC